MTDSVPKILYAEGVLRERLLAGYPEFEKILSDSLIPHQTVIVLSDVEKTYVNTDGVMYVTESSFAEVASGLKAFLQSYRVGGNLKASLKELFKILTGGSNGCKK